MELTKESIDALRKEIEADLASQEKVDALGAGSKLLCDNKELITSLAVLVATAWVGKGGAFLVKIGLDDWFSKHCG